MPQISNNEIKKVKSLQQKKFRDEYGLFIVEGEKMVAEAFNSRFHVENIYKRDEIGEESMKRISALANPSPALAVVRKP
jgi:TrmH family RNA methyltransferase